MHFQEMYRDGLPIADGVDAIPHGFDAITAISSIRVALLPFQSLYHPQEIQRIATPTNALQTPAPIPIESAMSTGRYTRIHTRQHSDPLFPPHPSRNAFAIAFTHSSIYTQQDSIHRFAASCDGNNLHSTPLHPTFNFIHGYYILYTHQGCLESHVCSASPTERFTATSLHPTRHLLFIFPLSQPHLLSFHLFSLFWICGKRSRLILCGRYLFLPISTLLLFIPFIITQSNPSLLHSLVSKQTLHTHSKT